MRVRAGADVFTGLALEPRHVIDTIGSANVAAAVRAKMATQLKNELGEHQIWCLRLVICAVVPAPDRMQAARVAAGEWLRHLHECKAE